MCIFFFEIRPNAAEPDIRPLFFTKRSGDSDLFRPSILVRITTPPERCLELKGIEGNSCRKGIALNHY